jgi:cyclophilin family peptidyl-prolyl cis-trans isomerase
MGLSIFPCLARGANPRVELKTNLGVIQLELYPDKAPITVENFLSYVNSGFYNGTIFHRVIPNFMVQGGGFTPGMNEKSTKSPIKNEAGNRLANSKGTIAMARTSEINSATSEFFINVVNNDYLNHRNNSPAGFGYCVFGRVIKGMDVVGKIAVTQTHSVPPYENVPVKDVVVISAQQIK